MSARPEAMRLADYIDHPLNDTNDVADAVSSELRRLHTENERLHQINQSHEMKLSVRGYEIQIADLEAQRDALLEACRAMLTFIERHAPRGLQPEPGSPVAMARAAIKAVEGEKT